MQENHGCVSPFVEVKQILYVRCWPKLRLLAANLRAWKEGLYSSVFVSMPCMYPCHICHIDLEPSCCDFLHINHVNKTTDSLYDGVIDYKYLSAHG